MSEKKTLDIIDGTLRSVSENFQKFIEVLETAKNELIVLEKYKEELNREKNCLKEKRIN